MIIHGYTGAIDLINKETAKAIKSTVYEDIDKDTLEILNQKKGANNFLPAPFSFDNLLILNVISS